jgi:hypothetical protein
MVYLLFLLVHCVLTIISYVCMCLSSVPRLFLFVGSSVTCALNLCNVYIFAVLHEFMVP